MPNDNWGTPDWILDSVREFYGGTIDLDPFSSLAHNERVKATKYYTIEDNAYKQEWNGNVFCNPPYSKPNLSLTTEKAKFEISLATWRNEKQIILLIPAYTSTKWFQGKVFYGARAICFLNKRVSFFGVKKGSPTFHSILVYYGDCEYAFGKYFDKFGHITYL